MPPRSRSGLSRVLSLLFLAATLLSLLYVFLGVNRTTNWPPARSDGEGYFAYLPLAFVYHTTDLTAVVPAQGTGTVPSGSFFIEKTGHWNIKYPIGVALTAAPFYLLAHFLCTATPLSHHYAADGYSLPYQLSLVVSGLLAFAVALWALARWLARRFPPGAVAPALVFIAFGTNLAHYATFDSFASHIYSVAAIALFLNLLDGFAAAPTPGRALLLGLLAGYGFLTRNTTVLYFVPFFLLPLLARRMPLWEWLRGAFLATVAGFVVIVPQLLIWKYCMGTFLAYSYGGEGFSNLGDPLFANVLWSWRKGAFLHFPFLLLPVAGLFLALFLGRRPAGPAGKTGADLPPAAPLRLEAGTTLLCALLQLYIAASWSSWPFGGSLGHRAFVDAYPLLLLGAAWLAARGLDAGRKQTVWIVVWAAVLYAQLFTQLYWFHFVKSDSMTRHDFAKLPKAALTELPLRLGGAFYDAAFDLRHPRNTSALDWWKETRAVLTPLSPTANPIVVRSGETLRVEVEVENLGSLTLKHWGRRGNILIEPVLIGISEKGPNLVYPLHKSFIPAPIDPGLKAVIPLTYAIPQGLPAGPYLLQLTLWHGSKDSLDALGLAPRNGFRIDVQP
ncbi:hypothetical protein SAMN05444156_0308 [Verrucomicrobium sp. GAS474]|uniref:hypothetical protein n=1 Tax=Verrucomicrobium sp. GAS474 TaxID=1882831 RepID=UPI00087CB059|nr:hypothetical protein [Verrucomicrobium sp. GAS474]SDT87446.1 hypothetical protein SAMN05444156_0308 [Verrucomicrobium sp. GAS474]